MEHQLGANALSGVNYREYTCLYWGRSGSRISGCKKERGEGEKKKERDCMFPPEIGIFFRHLIDPRASGTLVSRCLYVRGDRDSIPRKGYVSRTPSQETEKALRKLSGAVFGG